MRVGVAYPLQLEKVDKPCLLLLKERDILRLEVGKKVDNVMGGRCFSLTFSYWRRGENDHEGDGQDESDLHTALPLKDGGRDDE